MTDRARLTAWRDRRLTPLGFTLDGVRYDVPEHPARVWVMAILSDEPTDLLLELLPADAAERLWEDATDPEADLTPRLLTQIGQALLTRAAGRPWWTASMLVATLVDQWDLFVGLARDRALGDPLSWPIDELCAWVYLRLTQHAKKEDKARIDADLAAPPLSSLEEDADGDGPGAGEDSGWLAMAAQFSGAPGRA